MAEGEKLLLTEELMLWLWEGVKEELRVAERDWLPLLVKVADTEKLSVLLLLTVLLLL